MKKGQYQDALGKYTECLKIKPDECAIYTNRLETHLSMNTQTVSFTFCSSLLSYTSHGVFSSQSKDIRKHAENLLICLDKLKQTNYPQLSSVRRSIQLCIQLIPNSRQSVTGSKLAVLLVSLN